VLQKTVPPYSARSLRCRLALAIGVAAVVAVSPLGGSMAVRPATRVAHAAALWDVQVSALQEVPGGELEAQAYFPASLLIHAGDTVHWQFTSVHTVTFPSGQTLPPRNSPGPGPGEATLGPLNFPSGPDQYDGSVVVNSGRPFVPPDEFSYALTFTKPGAYGYVCLLHAGMRGEITVLPAAVALLETPEQAHARGQAAITPVLAQIRADAAAVRVEAGGGTYAVLAGSANGTGASANLFLPGALSVKRGDTVLWTRADSFNAHSVTFPGAGNAPPDLIEARMRPDGTPLLVQPAAAGARSPGTSYAGEGPANSGIMTLLGTTYLLQFDAPPGTYDYLCLLHPEMKGTITVTE
jgi:plastocyanin